MIFLAKIIGERTADMRATLIVAGLEAALFAFWIGSFVAGGTLGTPHQHWYVEFPLVFLLLPVGALVYAVKTGRSKDDVTLGVYALWILLLGGNLLAFFVYGMFSGGGV